MYSQALPNILCSCACCDDNSGAGSVILQFFQGQTCPRNSTQTPCLSLEDEYVVATSSKHVLPPPLISCAAQEIVLSPDSPWLSWGSVGAGSTTKCCTTNCRPGKVVAAPGVN